MNCEVCNLLNNDQGLVFQTDCWKVFATKEQSYLGRCVVSCKRHCPSLTELTTDEWSDFKGVATRLEEAAMRAFGADLVNWGCLMNNAFRKQPFNPHVHWHFRPRYKRPVQFSGKIFTDPDFGEHYEYLRVERVDDETIQKVVNALKDNLEE